MNGTVLLKRKVSGKKLQLIRIIYNEIKIDHACYHTRSRIIQP